jgi:hypothetical protein
MPLLNYTTGIDTNRTVSEIQQILAAKGAKSVSVEYAPMPSSTPAAVTFVLDLKGQIFQFRLPCNAEGVLKVIRKERKLPQREQTMERAWKIAWRIVKDWVEAQMAIIESNQASMAEVFLPYMVSVDGLTFYQRFLESHKLLEIAEKVQ